MEQHELWFKRALSDLKAAKVLRIDGVFIEDACFHIQQCVEKSIKSLLLYFGEEPRRTHNISSLLVDLGQHIEVPEKFRDTLPSLTDYVTMRYPGIYEDVDDEEYKTLIETADDWIVWVNDILK